MRRAIELASQGFGSVEPNPMVGAVVLDPTGAFAGEGWHQRYGGPHAEVFALQDAGERASGGTLIVTLEPCCHFGKTPPCVDAVLAAGVSRVVIGCEDPFPKVAGGGIAALKKAGLDVSVGLLEDECRELITPFAHRVRTGRPWVHAKWAMSLDGKLAARTGMSKWISSEPSREVVHQLRGCMDAIVVGLGTVRIDDPLLTVRPPGPKTPLRVVLDSLAQLSLDSQLVRTVSDAPLCVFCGPHAQATRIAALRAAGADVEVLGQANPDGNDPLTDPRPSIPGILDALGRRGGTHVLFEGGSAVFGALFDANAVNEVHAFIAPMIIGGEGALAPVAGLGVDSPAAANRLRCVTVQSLGGDVYIRGRVNPRA
jgi:diaminohydroxyphosphoribosylaminopyrimidine deaminase/5-amino-6-(5-phosphoribosylamino)uracil reductase